MQSVDAFRNSLRVEDRATVDRLRELIAGSHDDLEESIKWNAPNFSVRARTGLRLDSNAKVACAWFSTLERKSRIILASTSATRPVWLGGQRRIAASRYSRIWPPWKPVRATLPICAGAGCK